MIKNVKKKDEYIVSFTKEDNGCWYVDFPYLAFAHHNLMMVDGADELCEMLSYDGKHTKVKVYIGLNNPKTNDDAWRFISAHRIKWSAMEVQLMIPILQELNT